ncbi:39S ribosomal protein L44, mitochondrial [Pungitius pungitius]|uniref:39S ribosomal protein L44, mitochondrial n=1 Tax=Pungitius pungitius TaxID=134920 RepID=UPI002E10B631
MFLVGPFTRLHAVSVANMASGYILNRGVLTLGIHCQRVCRNVSLSQVREKKRWMKAYTYLMAKKLKLEGPPPPNPRSQQPHWDHHAEVQAFSSRLHENFSLEVLKTAFINPCYLQAEHKRRQGLGVGAESTALALEDNVQLSEKGASFTRSFLTDWCRASFPILPSDGVESVVRHLASTGVVTYVARNLGVGDLAMSAECPVPDDVLHSTFMAVVGALLESSGAEKTGLFLRDFLGPQLIGKDLFDMWKVVNPMGLLVEELTERNVPLPEPRLIRAAGASTVLPLYFVGLYSNQKLLAQGPGETLAAAEEEAARVALRILYGYTENRRPLDFSPLQQHQQPLNQSISSN